MERRHNQRPSRTDATIKRVLEELERSRPWLDNMDDLRSIVIDVKMMKDTGLPRVVIIKTESES